MVQIRKKRGLGWTKKGVRMGDVRGIFIYLFFLKNKKRPCSFQGCKLAASSYSGQKCVCTSGDNWHVSVTETITRGRGQMRRGCAKWLQERSEGLQLLRPCEELINTRNKPLPDIPDIDLHFFFHFRNKPLIIDFLWLWFLKVNFLLCCSTHTCTAALRSAHACVCWDWTTGRNSSRTLNTGD